MILPDDPRTSTRAGGLGHVAREFWRGATRPSATAVSIGCAVPLLAASAFAAMVNPRTMAGSVGELFVRDEKDDDAHATSLALALNASGTQRPKVVVLGTSAMRVATPVESLARHVVASVREPVETYVLATARQTPWDAAALADMVPAGARGVLAIGVGSAWLSYGHETPAALAASPRLGLASAALDEELEREGIAPPTRIGLYAVDQRVFLRTRLRPFARNLFGKPQRWRFDWSVDDAEDDASWNFQLDKLRARVAKVDVNADLNLAVLARLGRRLRAATKMRVLLAAQPVNPAFVREIGPDWYRDAFVTRARRFAEANGFAWCELNESVQFREEEFYDASHLRSRTAIERCTLALASRIAEMFDAAPPASGSAR